MSDYSLWIVRMEHDDADGHADVEVEARSESEAIGEALREQGVHSGWRVLGWWPTAPASTATHGEAHRP